MGRNLEERDALNEGLDEVIDDLTIEPSDQHINDLEFAETPAEKVRIQNAMALERQNSLRSVRSVIRAL
jgi:hypothetical protein